MSALLKPRVTSHLIGLVDDPAAFFEEEKRRMLDLIGDISGIRVTLNRILVQIWDAKKDRSIPGGGTIFLPDTVKAENVWQGVSGLVLKMGAQAYAENDAIQFADTDRCKVGDWIMFRKGDGMRTEVYKQECVLLESERGIRMVLDRPDAVY